MVALLPISLWIVGIIAAVQVLKPRLPKYTFRIQKIVPNFRGLSARLGSKVKLHNDNYVPIDIHALSFDLFYPDWHGNLDHIGQVTDVFLHYKTTNIQNQQQQQQQAIDDGSIELDEEMQQKQQQQLELTKDLYDIKKGPIWELSPRASFETIDDVVMKPAGGFGVMSSLSWDLMKHWGIVQVPSTGVIHVKANSKVPLTLSILCDNALDTWTLEMQGISCQLYKLDFGWIDLPSAVDELRAKMKEPRAEIAVEKVEADDANARELGSISAEEAKRRISWEDALPLLAR